MSSIIIPSAAKSPRYSNGTWYWYVGNTFTINWVISITKDSQPVVLTSQDKIIIKFWNSFKKLIHTFTFDGDPLNTYSMEFDEDVTEKFDIGSYTFCIEYKNNVDDSITTIGANYHAEVEKCH